MPLIAGSDRRSRPIKIRIAATLVFSSALAAVTPSWAAGWICTIGSQGGGFPPTASRYEVNANELTKHTADGKDAGGPFKIVQNDDAALIAVRATQKDTPEGNALNADLVLIDKGAHRIREVATLLGRAETPSGTEDGLCEPLE